MKSQDIVLQFFWKGLRNFGAKKDATNMFREKLIFPVSKNLPNATFFFGGGEVRWGGADNGKYFQWWNLSAYNEFNKMGRIGYIYRKIILYYIGLFIDPQEHWLQR